MFTKAQILDEIRRTAEANGGKALGRDRLENETGIRPADWRKFWARLGDAQVEAGYTRNSLQQPRDEDELLETLALLAREIGRIPVSGEIDLRARSEEGFPWDITFRQRFGSKEQVVKRLRHLAAERNWDDVVAMCDTKIAGVPRREKAPEDANDQSIIGYVYLLKSGRYYKIGRSNAAGRRERELQIQLPDKAETVHEIKTDDPVGIEAYWHTRFADRRKNGEWFELSAKDVAAFKRRKFM